VVEQLIFETNDFGEAERFKIFNENRESAFRALIESREIEPRDETRRRLSKNFETISNYLDRFLGSGQAGAYDLIKAPYYITYLLDRISIVEIRIERQDNVAMIFEVVNARGLGLKPYEILKGKLIGGLPAAQKEKANQVWTALQDQYFAAELRNTTERTIDLDLFFRVFFRAKFADSETDYEKFEGGYHYEMYQNPKIRMFFGEFQDRDLLFRRITEDFQYFAALYLRLRTAYDEEYLIFNKLLDQNQQYLLLLSNILHNDSNEKAKIRAIARKFPRSRGQDKPHNFYLGAKPSYRLRPYAAMMLAGKLRQEVHHGHCRPADSSCGTFTVGPGRLTASGGRDSDRPHYSAPPGAWALVWAWGRSHGSRHSGWASCALQSRQTAGRAGHVGAAATSVNADRPQ
jgi:hypothetical protein